MFLFFGISIGVLVILLVVSLFIGIVFDCWMPFIVFIILLAIAVLAFVLWYFIFELPDYADF